MEIDLVPMETTIEGALRTETLTGDIRKFVMKEGEGPTVHTNSKVWMMREGRLTCGKVFQKPSRYGLTIGMHAETFHSSGWSIALYSMKSQEVSWFCIGPEYHMFTEPELVGKPLWFKFFLEHFKFTDVPPITKATTLGERFLRADIFLDEGRRAFKGELLTEAVTAYNSTKQSLMIKKAELAELSADDQAAVANVVRRANLNLAITHLKQAEMEKDVKRKLGIFNKAGPLLAELLAADPSNPKILYHQAKFHLLKSELKEARRTIMASLAENSSDPAALALKAKIEGLLGKSSTNEERMCRKIFKDWEAELERERIQKLQAAHEAREQQIKLEESQEA